MDRIIYSVVSAVLIFFFSLAALAGNGNGLPPGPRYNLQVIAYDNCPAGDFTGSNRHQISVKANYQAVSGDLSSHQGGKNKLEIVKQNTIKLAPSKDC